MMHSAFTLFLKGILHKKWKYEINVTRIICCEYKLLTDCSSNKTHFLFYIITKNTNIKIFLRCNRKISNARKCLADLMD